MSWLEDIFQWIFEALSVVLAFLINGLGSVISAVFGGFLSVISSIIFGALGLFTDCGSAVLSGVSGALGFNSFSFGSNIIPFSIGLLFAVFALKLLWALVSSVVGGFLGR